MLEALWDDTDTALQIQAKAEFAIGEKLLATGEWGYSKQPWQQEFDAFRQECHCGL